LAKNDLLLVSSCLGKKWPTAAFCGKLHCSVVLLCMLWSYFFVPWQEMMHQGILRHHFCSAARNEVLLHSVALCIMSQHVASCRGIVCCAAAMLPQGEKNQPVWRSSKDFFGGRKQSTCVVLATITASWSFWPWWLWCFCAGFCFVVLGGWHCAVAFCLLQSFLCRWVVFVPRCHVLYCSSVIGAMAFVLYAMALHDVPQHCAMCCFLCWCAMALCYALFFCATALWLVPWQFFVAWHCAMCRGIVWFAAALFFVPWHCASCSGTVFGATALCDVPWHCAMCCSDVQCGTGCAACAACQSFIFVAALLFVLPRFCFCAGDCALCHGAVFYAMALWLVRRCCAWVHCLVVFSGWNSGISDWKLAPLVAMAGIIIIYNSCCWLMIDAILLHQQQFIL